MRADQDMVHGRSEGAAAQPADQDPAPKELRSTAGGPMPGTAHLDNVASAQVRSLVVMHVAES